MFDNLGNICNSLQVQYNNLKQYTYSLKISESVCYWSEKIYNKSRNHCIGLKSLYLFIVVLIKFKYFFNDNNLLNDKKYLNSIKKDILECGCISIKFTQWIVSKLKGSNNHEKYSLIIKELEDLFDNCNFHDLDYTKKIFKESLKINIDDIIDVNYLDCIASGSIGQVYRTRFKKNNMFKFNDDIIIKVKHPYMEYIKDYQMVLIRIMSFLQNNKYIKNKLKLHINFQDFIDNINKQIDFTVEAENCNRFYNDYKDNDYVVIPQIFKYSKDIIISSFEDGEYFFNISEYQKNKVAINLLALVSDMVLVKNFMHGDMHIKNWKVRKYNNNYQIILYDFGICFSGNSLKHNRQIWFNCETQNVRGIIEVFITYASYNKKVNKSENELIDKLFKTFTKLCDEPIIMNIVFNKLIYLFSVNDIIIDSELLNILIFMCLIEDVFKKTNLFASNLNKKINAIKIAKNQKLDIITFCKTLDVYPDLKIYLEEYLENLVKEETRQYLQKKNENKLQERDQLKLFDISKLSGFNFSNPDDLEAENS